MWDLRTLELRTCVFGIHSMAFSLNGQTPAGGDRAGAIRLWDVRTGELRRTFEERTGIVKTIAISPDGQAIASGSNNGVLRLWNSHTGEHLKAFYGLTEPADFVAISPDGLTIAGGSSWEGTVHLWDVHTGEDFRTIAKHTKAVDSVAFSPDGLTLASGTGYVDEPIRLWDVRTGQNFLSLAGHEKAVSSPWHSRTMAPRSLAEAVGTAQRVCGMCVPAKIYISLGIGEIGEMSIPWHSHPMVEGLPVGVTARFNYGMSARANCWKLS